MSKLLIIGAGGVGRVAAYKCAQHPEIFSEILLASRTQSKCEVIAEAVRRDTGHPNFHTARVDADNVPELVALIRDFQPAMVLHVALPYQDLTIMDACLETGVHYLDTANYEPKDEAKFEYSWQWAYHDRFRDAGLLAVLGCGFDPGVTGVFTARAAHHFFDEMHELDIIDANAGSHGKGLCANFNPKSKSRKSRRKAAIFRMANGWKPSRTKLPK